MNSVRAGRGDFGKGWLSEKTLHADAEYQYRALEKLSQQLHSETHGCISAVTLVDTDRAIQFEIKPLVVSIIDMFTGQTVHTFPFERIKAVDQFKQQLGLTPTPDATSST